MSDKIIINSGNQQTNVKKIKRNTVTELTEKEEKKFYDKVFGRDKKVEVNIPCSHRYQKASEGIEYPHAIASNFSPRNFIILFCEKCGVTTKSYF